MSRAVFLFVQTPGGRAVNLPGRRWNAHPDTFWGEGWREVVDRIATAYARWWLVECTSADAGRAFIAGHRPFTADDAGIHYLPGRILAHGSREPREDRKSGGGSDAE